MSRYCEGQKSVTEGPERSEWDQHRDRITTRYMDQDWTLQEVQNYMREEFGFEASVKMYKSRFKSWNLHKKRKRSEMTFAARTLRRRDQEGKDTEFMIRDRIVSRHSIDVYGSRLPAAEAAEMREGDAGTTPLGVRYYTPPPPSPSGGTGSGLNVKSEMTTPEEKFSQSVTTPSAQIEYQALSSTTRQSSFFSAAPTPKLNIQPSFGQHQGLIAPLNALLHDFRQLSPGGSIDLPTRAVLPLRDYIAHASGFTRLGKMDRANSCMRQAISTLPSNLLKDPWLVLFELCQSTGDLAASGPPQMLRNFLYVYKETCMSHNFQYDGRWQMLANLTERMVEFYSTGTRLEVQYYISKFLTEHRGLHDRMSIIALFDFAFALLCEGGLCIDQAWDNFGLVVRLEQERPDSDGLLVLSSLDYLFHIALLRNDHTAAQRFLSQALQEAQSQPEIYWRRWHLCLMLNGCILLRHQNRMDSFRELADQTRSLAQDWVSDDDPFFIEIMTITQL